ncbi:MAG TPA: MFS transporter [Terriglobia bacterium]|nr:MFS transporter [Terriglobia bacterium]
MTSETGGSAVHRTALVASVNACMFVFGIVLLLMGSLLPALHVSSNRAGSLGSFPLIGILAATVFIGPVLDKAGAKPALAAGLALIAAALAVMPALASFPALAAAALIYGLGGGVLNTATNALISSLNATGRGAALNLLGFSFSLGAISAPLLMSLLAGRFPPPTVLRILAIAPAAVLIAVVALRFPPPVLSGTPLRSLLRVLSHPMVWLIGLLLFFESGDENCMFVWAARTVREMLHLAAGRADLALVGLSVALGVGRLLAALWLDWLGSRNVLLLAAAVTITGVVVARSYETFGALIAGFAVIGLGMSATFPTALGLVGDQFPSETGTVFGTVMTVALVGGSSGPVVGGWLASSDPARVLLVPVTAAAAIAILTLIVSHYGCGSTGSAAMLTADGSSRSLM